MKNQLKLRPIFDLYRYANADLIWALFLPVKDIKNFYVYIPTAIPIKINSLGGDPFAVDWLKVSPKDLWKKITKQGGNSNYLTEIPQLQIDGEHIRITAAPENIKPLHFVRPRHVKDMVYIDCSDFDALAKEDFELFHGCFRVPDTQMKYTAARLIRCGGGAAEIGYALMGYKPELADRDFHVLNAEKKNILDELAQIDRPILPRQGNLSVGHVIKLFEIHKLPMETAHFFYREQELQGDMQYRMTSTTDALTKQNRSKK